MNKREICEKLNIVNFVVDQKSPIPDHHMFYFDGKNIIAENAIMSIKAEWPYTENLLGSMWAKSLISTISMLSDDIEFKVEKNYLHIQSGNIEARIPYHDCDKNKFWSNSRNFKTYLNKDFDGGINTFVSILRRAKKYTGKEIDNLTQGVIVEKDKIVSSDGYRIFCAEYNVPFDSVPCSIPVKVIQFLSTYNIKEIGFDSSNKYIYILLDNGTEFISSLYQGKYIDLSSLFPNTEDYIQISTDVNTFFAGMRRHNTFQEAESNLDRQTKVYTKNNKLYFYSLCPSYGELKEELPIDIKKDFSFYVNPLFISQIDYIDPPEILFYPTQDVILIKFNEYKYLINAKEKN